MNSSKIKLRSWFTSGTNTIIAYVSRDEYLKHLAEKYPCYVAYIRKKLDRSKEA